jgi:hypothetical protein
VTAVRQNVGAIWRRIGLTRIWPSDMPPPDFYVIVSGDCAAVIMNNALGELLSPRGANLISCSTLTQSFSNQRLAFCSLSFQHSEPYKTIFFLFYYLIFYISFLTCILKHFKRHLQKGHKGIVDPLPSVTEP